MTSTLNLGLPLVQPSQAQKHVTVNEALARLDGLTQLVLASVTTLTPPVSATDGETYFIPGGATGTWAGQDGQLAIWSNGGWAFVAPVRGWLGFIADQGVRAEFDGTGWVAGSLGVSANGAASQFQVVEFDHVIGAGATSTTGVEIPQYAVVFSITGRVKTAITGTLTGFEVGVAGATNRYGSGIGLTQGTWFAGVTGQPQAYYSDTPVQFTAIGGDFASGEIRVALHYLTSSVPAI